MSNTIQHKLEELEIIPPVQVWQQIAKELDMSAGDQQLRSAFDQLAIEAPPAVWNNITAALEPVAEADLTAKLREAAVVPPDSIWQEIQKKLDAPVGNKTKWIRYAAAALMAGILFSSAYFLSFSSSEKQASAIIESAPVLDKTATTNQLPLITQEQIDDRALEQSKKTYASVDLSHKKISRIASNFEFASSDGIISSNDPGMADINDRYIVLMTPDGNFIRVSKKLGDLVCCVSGEEEDPACKQQMGKWQKQLASADLSHSGDFGDILKLVTELQQEK